MESALEGGLGAQRVKVGAGNKSPGLAFKTTTVRKVVAVVLGVGLMLLLASGVTYREAITQRYHLFAEKQASAKKDIKSEEASIAQNLHLEAALALHLDYKEDVVRMLKRIREVNKGKIAEAVAKISVPSERSEVQALLDQVDVYILGEKTDYEKELDVVETRRKKQLRKVRESQTQALEKLLLSVTDVRLEALEEILTDMFETVDDSIEVSLDKKYWDPLENLVDLLYQGDLTLEEGLAKFQKDFEPHFGEPGVPADLTKKIHEKVRDNSDLADVLDEIYEGVQIYQGRDALKSIEKEWTAKQQQYEDVDDADDAVLASKADEAYSKSTVKAVLKIQELIHKGVIPEDFLDFDDIDLESEDDDDDDDDNED